MKTFKTFLFIGLIMMMSCNNETSKSSQSLLLNNLDTTVTPQQDFYQYACGGWMNTHPLAPEYSRFGTFDELQEKNKEQIRLLIEDLAGHTNELGSIAQKIGDLYNIGMDSALLNKQGAVPALGDMQNISAIKSKEELTLQIATLNKIGIFPFFSIYVYADDMNSNMNILHIAQGGYNMGDRDYYLLNDDNTKDIRAHYIKFIQKLFILCGSSQAEAVETADDVMKIETRLAKAALSRVELRDPYNSYHKLSTPKLQEMASNIQWNILFETLGMGKVDSLNVAHTNAIQEVNKIINETELSAIKNYLKFCIINSAASYLGDEFVNASFDFYEKRLSGKQELQPRWKRVIDGVNGVLGEPVGQMYVERYFPAQSKEKMMKLVKNLQAALGERIQNVTWMGDNTKKKALEKLSTFYIKIGYPDTWRDFSGLDIKYDSYWENIKRSAQFEYAYMVSKINQPVDKTEWLMTPQTVNAYYNPSTNEICFPAAILQPPFFNPEADDAVNYGAIGVVIGHEMTHGFDDQGRQYDKDGNLLNWWTEEDTQNFNERAKVLEDYFNNITVIDTVKANGKLTLGENIADYGGLTVSFAAFQKLNPEEGKRIEGFTPTQRFFLSYAGVWAGNIRDEEILRRTKTDSHSLGRWRVNGSLPHIKAFQEAFHTEEGNPMYLSEEKRASIW